MSTLAGIGRTKDYIDGDATRATFNRPRSVAFEPSEGAWLVVADLGNHVIRKIDLTSKVVSTLAGARDRPDGASWRDGDASLAVFNEPSGVSVHRVASGFFKIAVADSKNHAIRLIEVENSEASQAASYTVRTLVGAKCEGEGPVHS